VRTFIVNNSVQIQRRINIIKDKVKGGDTEISRDWEILVWYCMNGNVNPRPLVTVEIAQVYFLP